jgi:fumarate reductase subunit D
MIFKPFAILLYGILLPIGVILAVIAALLDAIVDMIQELCDRLGQFIYPTDQNNLNGG